MAEITKLEGLFAAVFTPFDENNEVNLREIPKYGKYLSDNSVKGVLVNGTIGEGTSLTFEERKVVLESWVEVSKTNNLDVFVQVGGTNLKQVKELAKHAESLRVSGIVCLPDLFFKPKSAEELVFYMQAVSQSAPKTPLFYYHTPSFTGVQVDMKKFLELGSKEIPTLAGIKFSHPVLGEALRCLPVSGGKFNIIHGYDQKENLDLNLDENSDQILNDFEKEADLDSNVGENLDFNNKNQCENYLADQRRVPSVKEVDLDGIKNQRENYLADDILSAAFTMGISSVMVTSLNFAPSLVRSIHEHIQLGRNNEALKLERRLMMLTGFVLNMTSWTAGYKAVTSIVTGINLGNPRLPLKPMNETQFEKLKNELKDKFWMK